MKGQRGFTLLEMIVATTILGVAVVGLMSGLAGVTRNAARLREYDRAAQLARLRMNDLLSDHKTPRNTTVSGMFDPQITGGTESGWNASVTTAEASPAPSLDDFVLDHVQLEVWWMAGGQKRSFRLEGYRRRKMTQQDVEEAQRMAAARQGEAKQ